MAAKIGVAMQHVFGKLVACSVLLEKKDMCKERHVVQRKTCLEKKDMSCIFSHSAITSLLRFAMENVASMHSVASMFSDSFE